MADRAQRARTCGRGRAAVAAAGLALLLGVACADLDDAGPGAGDTTPGGPEPIEATTRGDDPLASPDPPVGRAGETITVADDGSTLRMRVGDMAWLVLDAPVTADPSLSGDAVRLDAIVNVAESPVQEWEVHALTPGTVELSAEDGNGRRLKVRIDVSGS